MRSGFGVEKDEGVRILKPVASALSLAGAFLAFQQPAHAADACADLWFSRNAILSQTGVCFPTHLGKAVFGNAGCKTRPEELSSALMSRIERIEVQEKRLQCAVDTSGTALDVEHSSERKSLHDQPVADGSESTCIGYRGDEKIDLYAGHDRDAAVVGTILRGDDVNFAHESEDD